MPLRFRNDVATAETDYGTVLLDQRGGSYWELNHTGQLVVRTLLRGGGEAEAAAALVDEFDVEPSQASRDVAELVSQLRASGLVRG
jgi:hypothetical protein